MEQESHLDSQAPEESNECSWMPENVVIIQRSRDMLTVRIPTADEKEQTVNGAKLFHAWKREFGIGEYIAEKLPNGNICVNANALRMKLESLRNFF